MINVYKTMRYSGKTEGFSIDSVDDGKKDRYFSYHFFVLYLFLQTKQDRCQIVEAL